MVESVNTNRISGLASGMDTETIVKDLMAAERLPLDKMEQNKTTLTWQRDAFRDVNKTLLDLDNSILEMKLSNTYNSKSTSSSGSSAVTATATASAASGTYTVEVKTLASAAMNYSQNSISASAASPIDPAKSFASQAGKFKGGDIADGPQSFSFTTYDKAGAETTHTVEYTNANTLNEVFEKISTASGGKVRAFYDKEADKVIMERTETGDFNKDETRFLGAEIGFNGQTIGSGFFTDILQMKNGIQDPADGTWSKAETGGTNATFTYNGGYEVETTKNNYTINGMTLNFTATNVGAPATVSVKNDVDASIDKIVAFVNKYNEMLEKVNGKLEETRYRDYKPLTEAQKEAMSDKEVEMWEERAKSGLLKGESILSSGLLDMRQSWYGTVENGGTYTHLSQVGIKTSSNYRDNGKLLIDEDDLRKALQNDPAAVHKLFSNDVEGAGRGLINQVEDAVEKTMKNIESRAGKSTHTMEQYTLGKQMKSLDSRISSFESKLVQIENRYWRQFTAMEKAIQQMNNQSSYLMQQFM